MFDGGTVGRAIFISYRRDDTEGEAGRLYDDLARTFGEDSVFMDVAGINPGMDFRKAIDDNVATCGVLLAMIGPNWATIANSAGERRLDDPNDFVRLEVGSALARNIAVIPVLVHDAKMPRPENLPDNLKDLAYRNNVEITHARWNSDVQLLTKVLGQYVSSSSATNTEPVHATVPVQLPPPNAPAGQPATAKSSKTGLIAGGAALIVLLGLAAFFAMHHSGSVAPAPIAPAPVSTQTSPASPAAVGATAGWVNGLSGTWVTNGANALTGTPEDTSPVKKNNELSRVQISATGDQISIHGWGSCRTCDWGTQAATVEGNKATATWDFSKLATSGEPNSGRVAQVTIAPAGDKLSVEVENTVAGSKHSERRSRFDRLQ
jgi:hypothetical protein